MPPMTGFDQEAAARAEDAARRPKTEKQYIGLTLEQLHDREKEYAERYCQERCAPLVQALALIADDFTSEPPSGTWAQYVARDALAAYRAAQGAGRGM